MSADTAARQQQHESGLALFLQRAHRRRFRDSLHEDRLREKLRQKLAHFRWLDERYAQEVPTSDPASMAAFLRERGAVGKCWVMSEDEELDGSELPLEDALAVVLHSDYGALISCLPGRLAIYSEEAPNQTTTLLERAP